MSKVVYLLGAGASRGTRDEKDEKTILTGLPIVNEIEGELDMLLNLLGSISLSKKEVEDSKQRLIEGFHTLKVACSNHATIDTYAKKLWLQGMKEEFAHVELLLTIFFILEQVIHKPDKRYDAFFANVLQRKADNIDELKLPTDIRILSWNYDNQLELVYKKFLNTSYSRIRDILGIYDVKSLDKEKEQKQKSSIIKLNGTANFLAEEDWLRYSDTNMIDIALLTNILYKYKECIQAGCCDGRLRLNFAWEDSYQSDMLNNMIPKLVQEAIAVVVIGYSFPYFNRKIDRIIFENMPHLKKIYIQDKDPNRIQQYIIPVIPAEKLYEIKIVPLKDVDQFFLPPEL